MYMFKLLAVTDENICPHPLPEQIDRICSSQYAPAAVILRARHLSAPAYEALTRAVLPICQKYNTVLVVHTHCAVAERLHLSAVHLPLPVLQAVPSETRRRFKIISTSVHSPEEAALAQKAGATRLIAGHIYATDCKAGAAPRGLQFLRSICACALPVYAIGGIRFDRQQWQDLQNCGAAGACIMSAYMRL